MSGVADFYHATRGYRLAPLAVGAGVGHALRRSAAHGGAPVEALPV